MNGERTTNTLSDELKLIPTWAYVLGGALFICMQVLFNTVLPREPNPPPEPLRVFLGILVGFVCVVYVMLVGYVNRDAGRRGMKRWLWTLIVIFVPNAIGFIIYFVVRQPLAVPCRKCGCIVEPGDKFCRKCGAVRVALCTYCGKPLKAGDVFCANCGNAVVQTPAQPVQPA